jgi:hypothetical protein
MSLVVNFFGGPGTGKSTTAAHVFAELKWLGINAELVTEFAKDKVWEGSLDVLGDQYYLFGKQFHRLWRVYEKVDVVLTDSPLLLYLYYGRDKGSEFKSLVLKSYYEFINMNVFLHREKKYIQAGRVQTEEEARVIDTELKLILETNHIPYHSYFGVRSSVEKITECILDIHKNA